MPILIRLKAGEGRRFKKDMEHFVEYLLKHIPEIFTSETYQERRKEKIDALKAMQTKLVKKFEAEAAKENFALVPMQVGAMMRPVLLPLIDGKAANFEQIRALQNEGKLSKKDVEKMEKTNSRLMKRMEGIFEKLKELDKKTAEELKALDHEMVNPLIEEQINEIKNRYKCKELEQYLEEVNESVQENPEQFH